MGMLEWIAVILLVLWIGGFALNVAGNFIHILLVLAVVAFLWRFIRTLLR